MKGMPLERNCVAIIYIYSKIQSRNKKLVRKQNERFSEDEEEPSKYLKVRERLTLSLLLAILLGDEVVGGRRRRRRRVRTKKSILVGLVRIFRINRRFPV